MLAGQAVEQVDRYKYLGLVMHRNGTFTCAVESLKSAAQRALFALQARCAELGIVNTRLRCKLYNAVVKPVLSYGCEVWVPLVSDTSLEELERVHLSFLRRILDVPHATAAKHLYAETRRLPHKTFWWQQSLKYMHHLTSVESSRLCTNLSQPITCRSWGGGRLCMHTCPPWELPCLRLELTSSLKPAAQPWPQQLRQPS